MEGHLLTDGALPKGNLIRPTPVDPSALLVFSQKVLCAVRGLSR